MAKIIDDTPKPTAKQRMQNIWDGVQGGQVWSSIFRPGSIFRKGYNSATLPTRRCSTARLSQHSARKRGLSRRRAWSQARSSSSMARRGIVPATAVASAMRAVGVGSAARASSKTARAS